MCAICRLINNVSTSLQDFIDSLFCLLNFQTSSKMIAGLLSSRGTESSDAAPVKDRTLLKQNEKAIVRHAGHWWQICSDRNNMYCDKDRGGCEQYSSWQKSFATQAQHAVKLKYNQRNHENAHGFT